MLKKITLFFGREEGAVTVDWVVLTAAVVGLGVFIGLNVAQPVNDIDERTGQALTQLDVQDVTVSFSPSDP